MGQKLSDLKGYYSVMEERENEATSISNINEDTENTSDIHVTSNAIAIESSTAACSTEQYCSNGNEIHVVDQVDDHFESIYNIGIEGFRIDEGNGNLIDSDVCACRAACTCLTKSEFGFPDECIVGHRPLDEQNLHVTTNPKHGAVRTLTFVNGKRSRTKPLRSPKELPSSSKKKRNHWVLKFNCTRLKGNGSCSTVSVENDVPEPNVGCDSCICTGYRKTDDHHLGAGVIFKANSTVEQRSQDSSSESSDSINSTASALCTSATTSSEQLVDMSKFNPEDYPIEDCDERARLERAREIAEGVEPPPGFLPSGHIQISLDEFTAFFQSHLNFHPAAFSAFPHVDVSLSPAVPRAVHTQVDFIHCLVPDLLQITSCSFYWGKMDRYEAERLLEGRPEGTFLLRDSAQDEYLFSVSFRKYGRSLHARIEQWNHHFSFDSHDPGVFASPTVCGLIEHYKDPSCCMFFEPMLTIPLHRNFTFPLQHLCRAVVCSRATYDGVNQLNLPKSLKNYLKEYHYKQRVRVRRLDMEQ